jgi:hypothetical protein
VQRWQLAGSSYLDLKAALRRLLIRLMTDGICSFVSLVPSFQVAQVTN